MTVLRMLCVAVVVCGTIVLGASDAFAQGSPLFATLVGGNETGGGDLEGYGSASVILRETLTPNLCFAITVTGIATPTAAHIHEAVAGTNGTVVVTLTIPSSVVSGDPGTWSGCKNISETLLRRIRSNPSRFYINVHNGDFPNGALRGQLF